MPAAISFQAAAITSGSSTSRTLSFTVASAVGQERLVALCAIANATPATVTFTSVAIDGQSATLVGSYARATDGLGNGPVVAFFRAAGTANTTINVTCTISTGAVFDCRGAVWTLNDAGSLLASTSDAAAGVGNIGSLDLNVNTVIDGAAAAFVLAYACGTRNITWSGLTERLDGSTPLYSGDWHSAADLNVGSSSTPLTITASLPTTFDSNSGAAGIAVSFNPADGGGEVTGQQIINVGSASDDGTGDPARVAFTKCNANFTELYTAAPAFLTTTVAATTYQPLDADLTAIAALTGTNTIYYRSAADTWSPVVVSTGLAFSGGNLTATGGGGGTGLLAQRVFSTAGSTTYTPTAGMVNCIIECCGAGGGGGGVGAAAGNQYAGSGGGSGAYSRIMKTAAQVGASINVTVGAKGTGSSNANGSAGGDTFVGANLAASLCGAKGGSGGLRVNSSVATAALGGAGGASSSGVGDIKAGGNAGGTGAYIASTTFILVSSGFGGGSYFGGGPSGVTWPTSSGATAGRNADAYGCGGSGAGGYDTGAAAGGAGSDGVVIITEYQ